MTGEQNSCGHFAASLEGAFWRFILVCLFWGRPLKGHQQEHNPFLWGWPLQKHTPISYGGERVARLAMWLVRLRLVAFSRPFPKLNWNSPQATAATRTTFHKSVVEARSYVSAVSVFGLCLPAIRHFAFWSESRMRCPLAFLHLVTPKKQSTGRLGVLDPLFGKECVESFWARCLYVLQQRMGQTTKPCLEKPNHRSFCLNSSSCDDRVLATDPLTPGAKLAFKMGHRSCETPQNPFGPPFAVARMAQSELLRALPWWAGLQRWTRSLPPVPTSQRRGTAQAAQSFPWIGRVFARKRRILAVLINTLY